MDKHSELRNASFYCPITEEVMIDPVVDPEGNSYERAAIVAWLQQNSTSPITRSPLRIDQLIPNRSLRSAIEDEKANGGLPQGLPLSEGKHEDSKSADAKHVENLPIVNLDPVQLTVTNGPISSVASNGKIEVDVVTSIINPDCTKRCPADVVCVVDVSGSMGGNAALPGASENSGLSLLDIVKHALKTIVNTLQPSDRLALVSYSNTATVVFGLTPLNEAGKARALSLISSLEPDGLTNLWDGLLKGLDVLSSSRSPSDGMRNMSIMLLTDGVPNVEPPRGHLPMLKRYKETHGGAYPGTISTFGFGYNLKSALLRDLAVEGGGMYAFIPDSGFVGTAFVNALSNQLVSFGTQAVLSLEWQNEAELEEESNVLGNPNFSLASWGARIDVGNLHFGQRRDFVVCLKVPQSALEAGRCFVRATLKYDALPINAGSAASTPEPEVVELCAESNDQSPQQVVEAEVQIFRCRLIDTIADQMDDVSCNGVVEGSSLAENDLTLAMESWLKEHALGKNDTDVDGVVARVEGLYKDLTGQISEAVSKNEYFQKWGRHYLPSLQRAHALQQCNNFKDPGIQFYGGQLFNSVRDVADDVFCSMPPPVASVPSQGYGHYGGGGSGSSSYSSAPAAPAVTTMRSYYNASAPCFPAHCKVAMADGNVKRVGDISKGDLVVCPNVLSENSKEIYVADVECVVKTVTAHGYMHLVMLESGLVVTPWHPVHVNGEWSFPMDVRISASRITCDAVYSFVLGKPRLLQNSRNGDKSGLGGLARGPSMLIDGTKCITLAHALPINDAVASHEFYGTEAVVNALKKVSAMDYESGTVTLQEGCVTKDVDTGRACGFRSVIFAKEPMISNFEEHIEMWCEQQRTLTV